MFVELPFLNGKVLINVNQIVDVSPTQTGTRTMITTTSVSEGENETWTILEPYDKVKTAVSFCAGVVTC